MPNVMEQSCNGCVRSKTRPEPNPVCSGDDELCVCVHSGRHRKAQTLMSKSLFKIVRNQNCHKWITYILKSNIGMVMVIQTAMGIPIDNGRKNTSQWIDECPEDRQFAQVMTEFSASVATHHVIPCRRNYTGLGQCSWTSKLRDLALTPLCHVAPLGEICCLQSMFQLRDFLPDVVVATMPWLGAYGHLPGICDGSYGAFAKIQRFFEPSLLLKSWKIRSTEVLADALNPLNLRKEHLQMDQMEQEGRPLISSF